jgi:hypothetical protein
VEKQFYRFGAQVNFFFERLLLKNRYYRFAQRYIQITGADPISICNGHVN